MDTLTIKVCSHCGSEAVTMDCSAQWNESAQDWEICGFFDSADCNDCGGQANIIDRKASPVFTSAEILQGSPKDNIMYMLQEYASCGIPVRYQLTEDELGWLQFARGKYCIADYIDAHKNSDNVLTIDDAEELSRALDNDCLGWGKATCLADFTALQHVFFWLYSESENSGVE